MRRLRRSSFFPWGSMSKNTLNENFNGTEIEPKILSDSFALTAAVIDVTSSYKALEFSLKLFFN